MKCFICGKEMEEGSLQSNRQIYYPQEKDHFHRISHTDSIKLTSSEFGVPNKKVFHCKNCKKIVLDY